MASHRGLARFAGALCVVFGSFNASAGAQEPAKGPAVGELPERKFAIDDRDPVSSVPSPEEANNAPLDMGYWVMAVSDRAEAAVERGDHAQAARYYEALAAAVPERALAFSKLCRSLELAGQRERALTACRSALGKSGVTVDDHARYVRLVLAGDATISETQLADVDAIIVGIEREFGEQSSPLLANQLSCELGLRVRDRARLERCVTALGKLAPEDPRTLAFDFARQLQAGEFDAAERLVARARERRLPAEAIGEMVSALRVEQERAPSVSARVRGWVVAALAAGAGLVVALLLRGWRMRGPRVA